MNTAIQPGTQCLWHRSDRGSAPRPVLAVKLLPSKVRVLDLCEGDVHNLKFRDVDPRNLTTKAVKP
jgi:hypothetical protein